MGVDVGVWRARVGIFNGGCRQVRNTRQQTSAWSPLLPFIFIILTTLLVIGNVELNPGPDPAAFPCSQCSFNAKSARQNISHQKIHEGQANFRFSCPYSTCHSSYTSFQSVTAHLFNHGVLRDVTDERRGTIECSLCHFQVASSALLCAHVLDSHLDSVEGIPCPLANCPRKAPIKTRKTLNVHLSQYHPGWKSMEMPVSEVTISEEPNLEESDHDLNQNLDFDPHLVAGNDCSGDTDMDCDDESESCDEGDNNYSTEQVESYIANFYALMEGKLIIPSSSVDIIASRLSFISEILRKKLKANIVKALKSRNLADDDIANIVTCVLSDDPLYNTHHANAPGIHLLTKHVRREYYKKHFKYIPATEINPKVDPSDREHVIQYIPIKDTLKVLLEDSSVKQELCDSFQRVYSNPSIISDYQSGIVFQSSEVPNKRIDLLLFADGFKVTNPLGSAKKKHGIMGMYVTLGNFRPHMRSYLRSIRLVMLVLEDALKIKDDKNKRFYDCFKPVVKELKQLEERGIMFNGEMIPVRLQFILGDNLGQHTIGGFLESFTSEYFCRYCEYTKTMYEEDKTKEKVTFRSADWRSPFSYQAAHHQLELNTRLESFEGIKRKCPFNSLKHFDNCQPRQPPCLAHDLFIGGVVDVDLASIIDYFVTKKRFSYRLLNRRITKFTCLETDANNKPAQLSGSGQRLGGHAIQNWTLLRLLPFLIGDKILASDKHWKLYLLLKAIVELICAPSLSSLQIEEMRKLIKKYIKKRKVLSNGYIPKHHYFSHYPDLYLMFGPLIRMWTMAFEHYHQYFKQVARSSKNFINILHTMASKYSLLQAYQSMGTLFSSRPLLSKTTPLVAESYDDAVKCFLQECNFSTEALDVECITVDGLEYKASDSKRDRWVLLEKHGQDVIIGKTKVIIWDRNMSFLLLEKYRAVPWGELGIFKILDMHLSLNLLQLNHQEKPMPHAVYLFDNKLCFSLKHSFLSDVNP